MMAVPKKKKTHSATRKRFLNLKVRTKFIKIKCDVLSNWSRMNRDKLIKENLCELFVDQMFDAEFKQQDCRILIRQFLLKKNFLNQDFLKKNRRNGKQ